MHPLLLIYASFSLIALAGLEMRDGLHRSAVWLSAWGAMGVILIAAAFRPLIGDTGGYAAGFQRIRTQQLSEALFNAEGNHLFVLINWLLGQLGSSPWWLIATTTAFCGLMLWNSLRHVLSPIYGAVAILLYSVYPFFIFYVASGMKQALAMALLLQGYVILKRGKWRAVMWIGCAILLHSGAALVLPFLFLHWMTWRPRFGYRNALIFSITVLLATIIASLTNLNASLLNPFKEYLIISSRYDVYFMDPTKSAYRSGFRLDFTIFSLLPLLAGIWLRNKGSGLSAEVSGWWINLYILLASLYQLFAFAPYADRFAGFGWYLIPMILIIMLAESGRRRDLQLVLLIFSICNILILQFYTGNALNLLI